MKTILLENQSVKFSSFPPNTIFSTSIGAHQYIKINTVHHRVSYNAISIEDDRAYFIDPNSNVIIKVKRKTCKFYELNNNDMFIGPNNDIYIKNVDIIQYGIDNSYNLSKNSKSFIDCNLVVIKSNFIIQEVENED